MSDDESNADESSRNEEETEEEQKISIIPANKSCTKYRIIVNGKCIGGESVFTWSDMLTGIEQLEKPKLPPRPSHFAKCWNAEANLSVDELKSAMESVSKKHVASSSDDEEEEEPLPDPNFDVLCDDLKTAGLENMEYEFEVGICTATCAGFKEIECPPWVIAQAPPAAGKDFLCSFFDDERISKVSMRMTKNALSPGKANAEQTDPIGVYQTVRGKMWIISELGILFRDEDEAVNFLYEMLSMYGKQKAVVDDPTGEHETETYFTVLYGGTRRMVDMLMGKITSFGPRYMVMEIFSKRRMVVPLDKDLKKKIKDMVTAIVLDARKKPLPPVNQEVRNAAFAFAEKFTILRSAGYASCPEEAEDTPRVQLLLETCARLRAMIHNRLPTKEDVKWWEPLFYPTIGHRDAWKRIVEGKLILKDKPGEVNWHRIIRGHLETMGIGENKTIQTTAGNEITTWELNDSWKDFTTAVVKGLHYNPDENKKSEENEETEIKEKENDDEVENVP